MQKNIVEQKSTNKGDLEDYDKQQRMLENELRRVRGQLEISQKVRTNLNYIWSNFAMVLRTLTIFSTLLFQKLDENSSEHSRWEHDLLFLRQQLQSSASRDMQHGLSQSGAETLAIEGELAQVQQRAAVLHRARQSVITDIQLLTQRKNLIKNEIMVRPSPTGVAGAEQVAIYMWKLVRISCNPELTLFKGSVTHEKDLVAGNRPGRDEDQDF